MGRPRTGSGESKFHCGRAPCTCRRGQIGAGAICECNCKGCWTVSKKNGRRDATDAVDWSRLDPAYEREKRARLADAPPPSSRRPARRPAPAVFSNSRSSSSRRRPPLPRLRHAPPARKLGALEGEAKRRYVLESPTIRRKSANCGKKCGGCPHEYWYACRKHGTRTLWIYVGKFLPKPLVEKRARELGNRDEHSWWRGGPLSPEEKTELRELRRLLARPKAA